MELSAGNGAAVLLNALLAKESMIYCFNFGIFSDIGSYGRFCGFDGGGVRLTFFVVGGAITCEQVSCVTDKGIG